MKMNRILALLSVGLCAASGTAHAEYTKAGTQITNVATVTIGGVTTSSNEVVATVLPRPNFNVVYQDGSDGTTATGTLPAGYAQTLVPGAQLVTPYNVVNTGNTDQTITLAPNTDGSPNTGQQVTYYLDANGDGVLSDAERAAGPITSVFVPWNDPDTAADEGLVHIIQVMTVPGTATQGQQFAASPQGTGQVFDPASRSAQTVTESPDNLRLQYSRATVQTPPAVAIGPVGNPTAPEGSDQDQQSRAFAVVGTPVCFDHTAQNTGGVRDNFTVTVNVPTGNATPRILNLDGTPFVQPVSLEPGQTVGVRVCYDLTQAGAMNSVVTISGTLGTSNSTKDLIGNVDARQLDGSDLVKTYRAWRDESGKQTPIAQGTNVQPGDFIEYTLSVHNPYSHALSNVVVSDALPAQEDWVSSSDAGTVSGTAGAQTASWTISTLAAGETRQVTVTTQVSTRAKDGDSLVNHFNLVTSDLPGSTFTSNDVTTGVWQEDAGLDIQKTVNQAEVTIGDRITYTLTITNKSETASIVDTDVVDQPPAGIEYIAGTSTLGGQPLADPVSEDGNKIVWKSVATLAPKATIVLTYQTRVTPLATGDLVNYAMVKGVGGKGKTAIASSVAKASIKTRPTLQFSNLGDIVGQVFVDRNRNGTFDEGIDTPLPRARLLLAGGRESLSDVNGRYSFPNVVYGTQAIRLDPNSTPYQPLSTPQSNGLSGTQTVWVRGLTSVNFPLAPLAGDIANGERQTTARFGDVTVTKTLQAVPGGYQVTLTIHTPRALNGVTLNDPLPQGAALTNGQNTLSGNLESGDTTLSYQFNWTGNPAAATTDPALSWRN